MFYEFDDHILIWEANRMFMNIQKLLLELEENQNRDIVILTTREAGELSALIYSEIPRRKAENICGVDSRVS